MDKTAEKHRMASFFYTKRTGLLCDISKCKYSATYMKFTVRPKIRTKRAMC